LAGKRTVVAVLAAVVAGVAVLVMNTGSGLQVTAHEDVRLATADAECGLVACTIDGITPDPNAVAYTAGQLALLQSFQFARAVSLMSGSLHLTPQEIWRSVRVEPLGRGAHTFHSCWWASQCAAISFQASSEAVATAVVRRYSEVYMLWTSQLDVRNLIALTRDRSLKGNSARLALLVAAVDKAKKGMQRPRRDRITGASALPITFGVETTGQHTLRHTAELAVAAAAAVAMILLGAFGLIDARRHSGAGGEAPRAHRPTLG
jgi:hypothetical protein